MNKFIYLLGLLLISSVVSGQDVISSRSREDSIFTMKVGQLENGLRYVIKPVQGDQRKVLMRLIVMAGSNQEDKDQYQIAHLLEHMVYNSTKKFPSFRSNPGFFSQLDMEPRDIPAFVGDNSTQYQFNYPRDVPRALDTALSLYHDIAAGNVLFDPEDVQTERKALYQEYLFSNSEKSLPTFRNWQALTDCGGEVPLAGELRETVMNSSEESLKSFYRDWYRPDFMTIMVVGNLEDADLIENKIKAKFKDIKMPDRLRHKEDCWQNYLNSPKHFVTQETEVSGKDLLPQTEFNFYFRNNSIYFEEFSAQQNEVLWDLIPDMISNRLKHQQQEYNIDYITRFNGNYELPAVKLTLSAPRNEEKVIEKIFSQLEGISTYGFSKEEWNLVVDKRVADMRSRDYLSANLWSDLLFKAIISEKPLSNFKSNHNLEFIKNLDVAQLNKLLKKIDWQTDDIAIVIPEHKDQSQFTQKNIRGWINDGVGHPLEYQPIKVPKQLLTIKEKDELSEAEVTERSFGDFNEDVIVFENGLKVILKAFEPMSGRYKEKIMVHGFSPKGAECLESPDYQALLAPYIIKNSGVGGYDKFVINKLLEETSIPFGVFDYIRQSETGLKAEVSPEDIEILLQLIYLSFTQPRYDIDAFEDWKIQELKKSIRNSSANNNFLDFINHKVGLVEIPKGEERYRQSLKVDYEEAFKEYKRLHSNAEDFTFIITGNFKKNKVLPLLQKYLGNLPNSKETYFCDKIKGIDTSGLKTEETVLRFQLPENVDNDFMEIRFTTPFNNDPVFKKEIKMEFLKQALNLKLRDLRYKQNLGVYFSVASGSLNYDTKNKTIQIYLQSNRQDFDKVFDACNTFFEDLKENRFSAEFFKTLKESAYLPKWQEEFSNSNKSVMQRLYGYYRFDVPVIEEDHARQFIQDFNDKDLVNTAIEYLNNNYKMIFLGSPSQEKKIMK
ncbi:insulinase family protein [Zunongwangia sp. F363]|uniref:Insulinase family protein n=1 Tax=Autumnicola tepida TaxID=3075595 RepID=A0ABU3C762_9FLAO|nr:insulinase family protein [Zunongwangia sp. F363]MDT0642180.1 insulinase family protein [Zunongwangia sp. F363]